MKKIFFLSFCIVLLTINPGRSEILEDLWNKYVPLVDSGSSQAEAPIGRLFGAPTPEREAIYKDNWRYRSETYELHFDNPVDLARTVFGIALHAGDIDETIKQEQFVGGVLGYHYRTAQITDWLNDVVAQKVSSPSLDEGVLVGMLLQDGVIHVQEGRFQPTGRAGHVLAAAPGKKRSFEGNLLHERLHVLWDEDRVFQEQGKNAWKNLSDSDRAEALKKLARYASGNEQQLIEEWAIYRAETTNMHIR
jgi:hypothetical protein